MTIRRYLSDDRAPWTPTPKGTYTGGTTGFICLKTGLPNSRQMAMSRVDTSTNITWNMLHVLFMIEIEESGSMAVNDTAQFWHGRKADATSAFKGYLGQVWLSQGQTNTLRGTVLATAAVGGSTWATTAEQTNVGATRLTGTGPTALTKGDWLIAEVGSEGITSSATAHTADLLYGGMAAPDISGVQSLALPGDSMMWVDITGSWESCFHRLPKVGTPTLMAA